MYAVATFLVVAVITMVFTKLSTGALIATGMPPEVAAFQARSAFSGAGFTTTEAENVVNHPVRRQIITVTMFVGTLGTPTLVVTVLLGFIAPGPGSTTERSLVILSGFVLVAIVLFNRPATRALEKVGRRYAQRRLLPALEHDGQESLSLPDDHVVASVHIQEDPIESPRSLRGLDHVLPGVVVLGIERDDGLVAEPPADLSLRRGDRLLVFGTRPRLVEVGMLDE